MINKIKYIYTCYQLGKHILDNLLKFPDFEFEDLLRKQSHHIEVYGGTLHTLDYVSNKKWHEISRIYTYNK